MSAHLSEYVLLTEKCTERSACSGRIRFSELTDEANTHWHIKPGLSLVSTERVIAAAVAAEREAWAGKIEVLADGSCHHCGRGPDDDGDHTCHCPDPDGVCFQHLSDPVVSLNALRALIAEASP